MKKFLMGMALCVAATSGLHAQDTTFDGTLDCNGNRYMSIPQSDAFNVAAGTGEITVTARIFIRNDYYGKARGIICSRWHEKRPGGLAGNNLWYKHGSGYDIHGGESTEHCFSNNVTVDGSYYRDAGLLNHLGTLSHSYENTAGKLSTGTWAHIAWTFKSNGGTSVLYINGIEVESVNTGAYKSASPDGKAITNRSAILVGGRYCWKQGVGSYETRVDNDAIWDGKIDDVRFYGKALSADDIKKDKESGFPLAGFDLIAAYDFEHIVDNKVADISGNGHNADLVVVKGDQFPAATKQHTLTSKVPEVEGATLRLESSCNGLAPVGEDLAAGNIDLAYNVSDKADYRISYSVDGVNTNLYEFLGLYVNGVKADNAGTFLKADADVTAELRFREYPRYSFSLVHYDTESGVTSTYPFDRDTDNIYRHSLTTGHSKDNHFYGHFYVTGTLDNQEKSALADGTTYPAQIELYANPAETLPYDGEDVVNLGPDTDKPLFLSDDSTVRFTSHNADNAQGVNSGYAAVPTFTLVYEPDGQKTLRVTLQDGGIQTGLATVDTDITASAEFFTLQGVAVDGTTLTPGIYIMRRGTTVAKVLVK